MKINKGATSFPAVLALLLFLSAGSVSADSADSFYPVIEDLNYSDLNFRQLQEDIEFYYRAAGSGRELPPLIIYSYRVRDDSNIFTIASAAGLPYETVATFNRIANSKTVLAGKTLLLPSQPGIFLPEEPESDLEFIALSWRSKFIDQAEEISIGGLKYYFFPGESFHSVERAYFLSILFMNPLPKGVVSSGYGFRKSPFGGHDSFHNGIDIAAPMSTPVFAAGDGEVTGIGSDSIYGNYIEILHAGGYSTFYGHLNKIFVELHQNVNSTMIIAEVGTTGLSTGPHLHFEVRRNGKTQDPSKLTPGLE